MPVTIKSSVTQRYSPTIGNGTSNPVGNDAAMDPSTLQLFTTEEIFERISEKSLSGLLHIHNLRDTANIFFKNGLIVAAAKGMTEGEDAVRQALDLRDPRYSWQPGVAAPMPPYRPVQIAVGDLVNGHAERKVSPEVKNLALPVAPPPMPMEVPQPAPPPFLTPGRGSAGMTTALPRLESPMTVQTSKPPSPTSVTYAPVPKVGATGTLQPELPALKKPQYTFVAVDNSRQRITLTKESTLVGRNPACDITLDHGSISRQHSLMQVNDRGLHIKDLGTTNGTKINGTNITEGYINPGDQLTMGHLVFVLEQD
jgi:hypothetical protein